MVAELVHPRTGSVHPARITAQPCRPLLQPLALTILELRTSEPPVREAWYNLGADRFAELCDVGYTHGDFRYVANALRANHEGMKQFFERSMARGTKTVDETEAYTLLQMSYKTNTFILIVISRSAHVESEAGMQASSESPEE